MSHRDLGQIRQEIARDDAVASPDARGGNRQFTVAQPNQVWAGDIITVWTTDGWLYLAARLMGALTLKALAIRHRTPKAGVLHHSDWGSQGGFK